MRKIQNWKPIITYYRLSDFNNLSLCCEYFSARCIWLYVLVMSHMHCRMHPYSNSCLNVKERLIQSRCKTWSLNDYNWSHLNFMPAQSKCKTWSLSDCNWSHLNFTAALSKEFFDTQATIECEYSLKCVCDMTRTYSQMNHTDK